MTLLADKSIEELITLRSKVSNTILNLEMGLKSEKKKADELDFYRYDKTFDKAAMEEQYSRSLGNIKNIQNILNNEKQKLQDIDKQIKTVNDILNLHGTKPCLAGRVPHTWQVLKRLNSGHFQHRKCTVCNTEEKVGYA